MRLRRCELSTPGSNERMIEKALTTNADMVFLDLEDAVAPNQKREARGKVINALNTLNWGKKTRAIRMNNIETEYAYEDVIEVVEKAGEHLDIIVIPKVKAARDVFWVDTLLTQIETRLRRKNRVGLEVLIEDVEALINVEEIARSSSRLEAIIFGPGDFSASQGVRASSAIGGAITTYPGDIWHYARSKIVVAARAAGIDAVDGPFADFKNPEGYRKEAIRSSTMGFIGKWAIHPTQIDIANELYSPTKEEVDRARRLAAAYAKAEEEGLGAITFDGAMIDAASVRIIRHVIDKADLIGM
ncbi:MAG: HpcH/HpaI aldolase/citrate lyase family protein [Candidatus Binataceae bacterium]